MTTYFLFQVGAISCMAVSAGSGNFRAQAFFADVKRAELQPVFDRYGIESEMFETPFNCLLVRRHDTLLLVDTGSKAKPLLTNLRQAGIVPEDINIVLLSHAHPDHYGGTVDSKGRPVFPNARYLISRVDLAHIPEKLAGLPLQSIEPETDVLDGVRVLAAPGHTAGQLAVKIESEGETLLYTSDVIAHPIHLEYPNWNIVSDADRAEAVRTRSTMLGQAADAGWWLLVYHFPFPGLCHIRREKDGWRITEQRKS